ncbi:MAG: hypothetical protein Q9214_003290 [Letrouitia sp. 1 TL-2023]
MIDRSERAIAILAVSIAFASCAAADSTNTTSQDRKDGWVSQPQGRGTFDILWSCLFTIFLCTWTSLHLNVPAMSETYWDQFFRKMRWMAQAIMAPEFVLGFATGQKAEARRSVAQFKHSGYPQWSIRHAFYANMGGFVLQPRESAPFPINAKQLHYLLTEGYIEFPSLSAKEVWDKSKADGFQKSLTCLQTGWFIVQIVGRAIQRLPVTTLELTTLSFVFCTLAMFIQWANKPLDVESPTILTTEVTISDILLRAGDRASEPYKQTPLDFIDDQSPSWISEVQPHLRFRIGPRERPLPRFTNDKFPVIGAGPDAHFLLLCTVVYCSIHFIAWNFDYPTHTELVLWHASCIAIAACALILWICETYQDGHRLGRWERWYGKLFPSQAESVRVHTWEKERRQKRFIPVWEFIIMTPVTLVYTLARTYIVVEVFLSQRSLPVGAFDTVQWSEFVPHF